MKIQTRFLTTVVATLAAGALLADDFTDNLETAKTAYAAGKYSEAIQALDYASQLVRQKKGEAVVKLLPAAPSGWKAEAAESETAAAAFMGGIVGAKREYTRESGGRVTIQIQSDSPLLQSLTMAFANPILLSSSGAKLETIKGQRCAVTHKTDDKSGDIKTVVDNRYLVQIEGSEISREDLVTFAKAIDYEKLAALK